MPATPRLRAVVFDFDGTLAEPSLDFALMKERLARVSARFLGRTPKPASTPALEWIEATAALLDAGASGVSVIAVSRTARWFRGR